MLELLMEGILEMLKSSLAYPANPVGADRYAWQSPAPVVIQCPSCRAHARKKDARHDRQAGICRFPRTTEVTVDCPACVQNKPLTHAGHSFR